MVCAPSQMLAEPRDLRGGHRLQLDVTVRGTRMSKRDGGASQPSIHMRRKTIDPRLALAPLADRQAISAEPLLADDEARDVVRRLAQLDRGAGCRCLEVTIVPDHRVERQVQKVRLLDVSTSRQPGSRQAGQSLGETE